VVAGARAWRSSGQQGLSSDRTTWGRTRLFRPARALMMNDRVRFRIAGLLVALLTACSSTSTSTTTIERVTNPDELKPLAFLSAGEVSRRDIEARLGVPWSTYEERRIVIYHLNQLAEPIRRAERNSNLHLVIVYAKDDRVQRWSLVQTDRPK